MVVQTRIINVNGDYTKLISVSEIVSLLQEIEPGLSADANTLQERAMITTWNPDDDVALTHLYAPELSRNYGYVYQYFYPNRNGNMRINLRIEFPIL